jgi:hypothetical protein
MFLHVFQVNCYKLGRGAAETNALLRRQTELNGIKPQLGRLVTLVVHTALAVEQVAKHFSFLLSVIIEQRYTYIHSLSGGCRLGPLQAAVAGLTLSLQ